MALDAVTGEMVWETEILDYTVNPALQTAGPIVAGGRVISGRSCRANATPDACVVTAHDALTGRELWRRRTIPGPGEPGDETWGDVPFERRKHVGTWMVPSYDPELDLVYIGTSVTSPAPKFMLGGPELAHLYHNSTLALDAATGDIAWVLPAPERRLGPRPSLRAPARRHRRSPPTPTPSPGSTPACNRARSGG